MPVLFNADGVAEDVPQELADQTIAAGTHTIPLVSPEGDPVGVPAAERDALLQQGYRLPSTEQLQSLMDAATHGTAGQAVIAGLEGAAETATLGLSGAVESALGVDPEAQRKRAEQNPIAHGVGEVVGAVAPALVGDEAGLLNVLGKAGGVGERAAKALVGGNPEKLATKLAGWAGRGAAESALMTGEHVLNEAVLGDPEATAEHALAEIGVSAVLGGAGNAILGKAVESTGTLASKLYGTGEELIQNFRKMKPNAGEIEAAAERLGVEPLPGQLSASKTVQDLQSQIAKEPTIAGRKEQAAIDMQYDAIRKATTEAVGDASPMSKAEVGDTLKVGLKNSVEEAYKPIEEMYSFLKEQSEQVPIDQAELKRIVKALPDIEGASKRPHSPEGAFTKRLADDLQLQTTVDDLKKLRTSVGNEANPLTKPELRYYSGAVQEMLDDLEEKSILAHVNTMVNEGRLSNEVANRLIGTRTEAKEAYKGLMETLGEVAEATGRRRVYGVKHFLDHLDDLPSEKLVDKLFQKGDSKFLQFFAENFPAQAETLGRYQKGQIAEKAFKDGIVQPGIVSREVKKLSPEVQKFLFTPEQLAKLDDATTLLDAMPKDINPSGTAKSQSWHDALNPFRHGAETVAGGLVGGPAGAVLGYAAGVAGPEVSSYLKRGLLRGLVAGLPEEVARHGALGRIMDVSQRTTKNVTRAAKAVFAREVTERLVLSRDERDRAAKKSQELSDNPDKLMDRLTKMTEGMDAHAPNTSSAMSSAASRAVQFLASKVPRPTQVSPFSPPVEPSEIEKMTFRRYADAVLDPVGVMSRIHDGSLMKADLEALQAVYPKLYASMRDAVTEQMTQAITKKEMVPYKTRLGVSMFLGAPVDRSLEPASIVSTQSTFLAEAAGQGNEASKQTSGMSAPARGTSSLSKVGAQTMTPEQAAASRRAGNW